MPANWGEAPARRPENGFSGIIDEADLRKWVEECKDPATRTDAFVRMQGALTNNAICSDLMLIDGAIDIFKMCAVDESGSESPATCILGRMGFKEYDPSLEENRDRIHFKHFGKHHAVGPFGREDIPFGSG